MNAVASPAIDRARSSVVRSEIRRLIWIYFWCLLFEGAVRKWVASPALSIPLLIVRDPILLVIYYKAFKNRVYPKCFIANCLLALAAVFAVEGLMQTLIDNPENVLVMAFGMRTNFFHLPLIFIAGEVCDIEEVKKIGTWTLLIAIPMAALMVLQFRSSPDALINTTAGGEGKQIGSAMGRIRPPGTFSFINGAAQYFSFATSFFVFGVLTGTWPRILIASSGLSILAALSVSGSRLALISAGCVFLALAVILAVRPDYVSRAFKLLLMLVAISAVALVIPFIGEGMDVMNNRLETAESADATETGMAGRILDDFLNPIAVLADAPILGAGLGRGTNVGAILLQGKADFSLGEGELTRIVMESGPLLGLAYLLFRLGLVVWLFLHSAKAAMKGNVLPLLLFGAAAPVILNGQFGQTTTLGFAAFGGGITLAACNAAPPQAAS